MRYAPCGRGKRYLETTAGARRLRNPGAKTGVYLLLFNQIDDACSATCTAAPASSPTRLVTNAVSVQKLVPMIVRSHLIKDVKNDQRSDNRQYQSGRMKQSSVTRSGKETGNQPTDNRTGDSEQKRKEDIQMRMQDKASDETGNKADNDIPNDV